jgi:hypothetical protein
VNVPIATPYVGAQTDGVDVESVAVAERASWFCRRLLLSVRSP